ncbi:MAG: Rieske (2Fe-2S) protein [Pseudomonadota bacterium]|nr:Rieske (2Fe-2S) protein [Pseudomonadota bacterium]
MIAPPSIGRRAALRGACAFAALVGCGRLPPSDTTPRDTAPRDTAPLDTAPLDTTPRDTAGTCADDVEPGGAGWVAIAMSEHPALYEPGGTAYVSAPEALLEVNVVHLDDGCFATVWRICTHGACDTEWTPEEAALVCPCHGSRFATDGAVLEGPATVPLRTFPTVRRGDTLWVWRPL